MLLRVRELRVRFGGITALDGVSFDVAAGTTVGIIGPNGAGKTTLFNCLSRLYRADAGDILVDGRSIRRTPAHAIAALGIGRTFQNLALFGSMTVRDTVLLGGYCRGRTGFLQNALGLPTVRREERTLAARVQELLVLLDLERVAGANVMSLPLLVQKRIEVARALAGEPRLLLLDEPASGLSHEEADALAALLERLRARLAVTLLVVEHRLHVVMRISDRIVVLDFGRKIADGTPAEIRAHPNVVRAYLGAPA